MTARLFWTIPFLGLGLLLPGGSLGAMPEDNAALHVTFGASGLQTLTYGGAILEDLGSYPGDRFTIGHMKATDLGGKPQTGGQYTWGENNEGHTWNRAAQTWSYRYSWGSVDVAYAVTANTLNLTVTTRNDPNSGVVFDGASISPLTLHFPTLPAGFGQPNYPQLALNTTGPSVTTADYGRGQVVAVVPDPRRPLYSGFFPAGGPGIAYKTLISGTTPDGLATFQPHNDRKLRPGQTDSYTVSLRFAPSGTPAEAVAGDAYRNWANTFPATLQWADRRPIGTVYLASSPSGDPGQPGGYPNNPRRYFKDDNPADFDVESAAGLAAFQKRVLGQAEKTVANLKRLGAQGVITWDIEGEQFPQSTSYVCEPDEIAAVAPEMESSVTEGPYRGTKLDDAYFQVLHKAGFRVGVCVRPQHFTLKNGSAQQVYLPDAQIAAELIRKAKYAHDRWGATLFYIDSTVDKDGAVLNAAIFKQVAAALPDSLLIPEESTPLFHAYTAPFKSFIDLGATGSDHTALLSYPQGFSAVLVNDADTAKLRAAEPQLVDAVRQGDVLMAHADYWQENNPAIVAIYAKAHAGVPAVRSH